PPPVRAPGRRRRHRRRRGRRPRDRRGRRDLHLRLPPRWLRRGTAPCGPAADDAGAARRRRGRPPHETPSPPVARRFRTIMFVDFCFELRRRKVPVSTQEWMALMRALALGLHDSSLDGFYHLARALCVKDIGHYDAFDAAFLAVFRGVHAEAL